MARKSEQCERIFFHSIDFVNFVNFPFGLRYSRAPPRGVPVGGRLFSSKRPRAHRRLEEILDGAIRFSRAIKTPPVRTHRGEPAEGSLNLSHPHRWFFSTPAARVFTTRSARLFLARFRNPGRTPSRRAARGPFLAQVWRAPRPSLYGKERTRRRNPHIQTKNQKLRLKPWRLGLVPTANAN